METYIYIIGAAILGLFGRFFYDGLKKQPPAVPEKSRELDLLEKLDHKLNSESTSIQSEETPSLLERMEDIEFRFERLRKDSLRYLQSGNQTWKRIQDRTDSEEIQEEELQAQADEVMGTGQEAAAPAVDPNSDLEWAKQRMIAKGENPVL